MLPAVKIILGYAMPHIVRGVIDYFTAKKKSEEVKAQEEVVDNIRKEIENLFASEEEINKDKRKVLIKKLREETIKLRKLNMSLG